MLSVFFEAILLAPKRGLQHPRGPLFDTMKRARWDVSNLISESPTATADPRAPYGVFHAIGPNRRRPGAKASREGLKQKLAKLAKESRTLVSYLC